MNIIRAFLVLGACFGGFLGLLIALVCTIALGPFFWVPYLLIYLALRAAGVKWSSIRNIWKLPPPSSQITDRNPLYVLPSQLPPMPCLCHGRMYGPNPSCPVHRAPVQAPEPFSTPPATPWTEDTSWRSSLDG